MKNHLSFACAIAALGGVTAATSGQLVLSDDAPLFLFNEALGNGPFQPADAFVEIPGGEFEAVVDREDDGLIIRGDGYQPLFAGSDKLGMRAYAIIGIESDSIMPTQVTFELDADYKVVNMGGSPDAPNTGVFSFALLYERQGVQLGDIDRIAPFSYLQDNAIPIAFADEARTDDTLVGNGIAFGESDTSSPFVLAPNTEYLVMLGFVAWSTYVAEGTEGAPSAAMFVEAGGVSGFDGLHLRFNSTYVPEPAAASLLAMGGLVLLRRRRR